MHNKSLPYRPDIDGLRALAVTLVVVYHAFPEILPAGFIGVDVFFVISGFLISGILLTSLSEQSFSLIDFYSRRIKRIFPALLLVLLSCVIAGWFLLLPDEYKELGKHSAGGAGFVSNLVLWNERGYFDVTAERKPLLHLWSLGIEEQFYFFWPIVLWAGWKLRINIIALLIACIGTSFFLNIFYANSDSVSAFYLPQTRAWELLLGAAVAYLNYTRNQKKSRGESPDSPLALQKHSNNTAPVCECLSATGIALLACGVLTITKDTQFPSWNALYPSLGAAMLIAAGPNTFLNKRLLSTKIFVWIGLISYPLYLWHWPLLVFPRIIEGTTPSAYARIGCVIAAITLAFLTYRNIEKPLRSSSFKWKAPVLASLMIVIGLFGYQTFSSEGFPARPAIQANVNANNQFVGPLWKYTKNDTCLNHYKVKDANNYGWWFCMTNKEDNPEIILLGTSYANHLYPGMVAQPSLASKGVLSIGACSMDAKVTNNPEATAGFSPCSGNRPYDQKILIDSIIENGSVRYAIIDGLNPIQTDATIAILQERLVRLEKKGIQIIIFKPHVLRQGDLKSCFSRPLKSLTSSCNLETSEREKVDANFQPLVDKLRITNPSIKFFDQNELYCSKNGCSLILDGMPLFRDEYSHYSEFASRKLAELFVKWAQTNVEQILK